MNDGSQPREIAQNRMVKRNRNGSDIGEHKNYEREFYETLVCTYTYICVSVCMYVILKTARVWHALFHHAAFTQIFHLWER